MADKSPEDRRRHLVDTLSRVFISRFENMEEIESALEKVVIEWEEWYDEQKQQKEVDLFSCKWERVGRDTRCLEIVAKIPGKDPILCSCDQDNGLTLSQKQQVARAVVAIPAMVNLLREVKRQPPNSHALANPLVPTFAREILERINKE